MSISYEQIAVHQCASYHGWAALRRKADRDGFFRWKDDRGRTMRGCPSCGEEFPTRAQQPDDVVRALREIEDDLRWYPTAQHDADVLHEAAEVIEHRTKATAPSAPTAAVVRVGKATLTQGQADALADWVEDLARSMSASHPEYQAPFADLALTLREFALPQRDGAEGA